eukprot:474216-Pyramimonas_sp.AAC.2
MGAPSPLAAGSALALAWLCPSSTACTTSSITALASVGCSSHQPRMDARNFWKSAKTSASGTISVSPTPPSRSACASHTTSRMRQLSGIHRTRLAAFIKRPRRSRFRFWDSYGSCRLRSGLCASVCKDESARYV